MTRPPMPARKTWVIGSAITAIAVAVLAIGSGILPPSTDTCFSAWEDSNASGDMLQVCAVSISGVKIANLTTHTEGLHGGCNRGINQSSSWNDCMSSIRLSNMPANAKAVLYQDINYSGQIACVGSNGTFNLGGVANDTVSSFRVIGGVC